MRNFSGLTDAEKDYYNDRENGVKKEAAAAVASERIAKAHERTRAQSQQHTTAGDGSITSDPNRA